MVAVNFDRARPAAILNLNEVEELRGWSRENGALRLGAGLTYAEAMAPELAELLPALAEASRTVGSPQIRNRGTIGGNLATASPAGDALPPLVLEDADVECASVRGVRRVPIRDFVTGVKRNALEQDELITAVWLTPVGGVADVHEGRTAERDGDRGRLACAECGRGAEGVVRLGLAAAGARNRTPRGGGRVPGQVAAAAAPIDDVRGSAVYRRHALRVMARRALERTLA